jgi:hypothetical protein
VWKINRAPDSECGVLRLSGRIQGDDLAELGSFLEAESNSQPLILDLAGVKLVDHEVVYFWRIMRMPESNCAIARRISANGSTRSSVHLGAKRR